MLVNYVDSILYVAILCITGGTFFITALYMFISKKIFPAYLKMLKKRRDKSYKKLNCVYKKYIKPNKKTVKFCLRYMLISAVAFGVMFAYRQEYVVAEEFVWSEEEQTGEESQTFCVKEREETQDEDWWKNRMHFPWYGYACDRDGDGQYEIDRESFAYYYNQLASDYVAKGERKDTKQTLDEPDVEYQKAKEDFEKIIKEDYSQLEPEMLWEGYKAGKKVSEHKNTSENIFQTGVLPEAAHENAYQNGTVTSDTILYAAAAVEQFDEVEQFAVMKIGEDVYVSKEDTFFRKGKMMYRECVWGIQEAEAKAHYGMMAYTYFDVLIQYTSGENAKYMTYVYYCGRTCLDILPNITDESLRKEICAKQLQYWIKLEREKGTNYLSEYKVEDKTVKELQQVRTQLESNVR